MKLFIVMCVCEVAVARILTAGRLREPEFECGAVASSNPLHQHPWLVYLEFYRRGVKFDRRCGGSLVTKRHVVTAAHCVKGSITKNGRITARLGEYDLSEEVDCVDGVCVHLPVQLKVAKVTVHPDYDGKRHDIAVLTLSYDAPYTDTIRPVCLPSGDIGEDVVFSASGWGENISRGVYSNVKKHLDLEYWSRDDCKTAYKYLELPNDIVCAGGEQGVDTCRGDSGGPLVWRKGSKEELYGVTSTGNVVCGTKGTPGIYTSVLDNLDWIREVVRSK